MKIGRTISLAFMLAAQAALAQAQQTASSPLLAPSARSPADPPQPQTASPAPEAARPPTTVSPLTIMPAPPKMPPVPCNQLAARRPTKDNVAAYNACLVQLMAVARYAQPEAYRKKFEMVCTRYLAQLSDAQAMNIWSGSALGPPVDYKDYLSQTTKVVCDYYREHP